MQIPIFLEKESYYAKKLYNSILENIDDLYMTLKNLFVPKINFVITYLFLDHTTFI